MRLLLRLALMVGAVSGLALLGLLAWSTGNASRFARYYDILLILNGIFALALGGKLDRRQRVLDLV